ncbi:MAG: hypothetical protein KDB53_17110 [Planctomycetes bacterium]|nr:hypothetical protein [Planctomycetota bacterium]
MGCPQSARLGALLTGSLNRAQTLSVLDHAKTCEDCKRSLEDRARLTTGRSSDEPQRDLQGCRGVEAPPALRTRSGLGTEEIEEWSRKGRTNTGMRRVITTGIILAGLLFAFKRLSEKSLPPANLDRLLAAMSIEEGDAWIVTPFGPVSHRPMVLTAWLPPGNDRVEVEYARDGQIVLKQEFRTGERGCTFDRGTVPGREGPLPAIEIILPFPDAEHLVLEPQARYFCTLRLANGRDSAPRGFRFDPE